jgi:hypothetical protein
MSSAAMLACVRLAAAKVEELHKLLQTELKNADDRAKQVYYKHHNTSQTLQTFQRLYEVMLHTQWRIDTTAAVQLNSSLRVHQCIC